MIGCIGDRGSMKHHSKRRKNSASIWQSKISHKLITNIHNGFGKVWERII